MKYYVYENLVHDFAKVHRADCSYCRNGNGLHGGGARRTGRWLGAYTDRETAFLSARALKRTETQACRACAP